VFFNLIDNAVKFTPPKGKIMLSLCKENKYARVSVADTGKGIPDAEKQKIFERFYRVNSQEEGSGLGLSIVRSIVDAHAGHIEVHSRLNQGSIFSVLLPIASPG
jgi:signal transduction histidine kinase